MKPDRKFGPWLEFVLILLIPLLGLALGVGATRLLNVGQADYGNLIVNVFFVLACVGLIRALSRSVTVVVL